METSMPAIRGLFSQPIVYIIPNYQRAYVWNQEDQWEPLWLDITALADRLYETGEYEEGKGDSLKPHFMGATVLKRIHAPVERAPRIRVVDGQQRLTTIQLLLAAVADALRKRESLKSLESLARDLTVNYISGKLSALDPDKMYPLAGDFTNLTDVMIRSREDKPMEGILGTIDDCYRFYLSRVGTWLDVEVDPEAAIGRAKSLLTAITNKLQVVVIYLNDGEDESAIFEALNARGEPLSEWEKTKNYILSKAGNTEDVDPDQLYEAYLKEFDNPEWRNGMGRGVGRRRISDYFLYYWLEYKLERQVRFRRVFREFRSEVEKPDKEIDITSWCEELKADSERFLSWETTPNWDGDVETVFHSRRRAMEIRAFWPLLFTLYRAETSDKDRHRSFRALDSFLWRRYIAGLQAGGYDQIAFELMNVLPEHSEDDTPFSDAIINRLASYTASTNRWPDDSTVRNAVATRHFPTWSIRQILESVERALMLGKHPGNPNLAFSLPIEHVLPQTSGPETWPLASDSDEDAIDKRKDITRRLGNLTLVEHGLNSKLSNRPWVEKRPILTEEDNLYINKELLNHAPQDHWGEEEINSRGQRLADYILEIWPHGHYVTGDIERVQA